MGDPLAGGAVGGVENPETESGKLVLFEMKVCSYSGMDSKLLPWSFSGSPLYCSVVP